MYEVLREKMDEREAKTLVQYIESRVEHKFDHAREVFPDKQDIHRLELKIAEAKEETNRKIAEGREETNKKFAEVNLKIAEGREETNKKFAEVNLKIAECNTRIAESKNDLIKWLFGLILGSTVAIISVMLTIFKMI